MQCKCRQPSNACTVTRGGRNAPSQRMAAAANRRGGKCSGANFSASIARYCTRATSAGAARVRCPRACRHAHGAVSITRRVARNPYSRRPVRVVSEASRTTGTIVPGAMARDSWKRPRGDIRTNATRRAALAAAAADRSCHSCAIARGAARK